MHAPSSGSRREAGLTILEAAIALTVLGVALLALWGTLIYCSRAQVAAQQKRTALLAAQARLEELRAEPFDTLAADLAEDGRLGDTFPVPQFDDGDGDAGRVFVYLDETADDDDRIGLPMDLNGDGDENDADVSVGYVLLPLRLTVRWRGPLGLQRVEMRAILRGGR